MCICMLTIMCLHSLPVLLWIVTSCTHTIHYYSITVSTLYRLVFGFGFGIIIVLPAVHEARVALWYPTSLPQSASMWLSQGEWFSPVSAAPTVCVVLSLHRTLLCSVSGNDQHVWYRILCMCTCVHVCVYAWRCTVHCTPSPIPSVRCVPKYEELSGGAAQAQLLHNPGGITEQEVRELQSHLCARKRKEGTLLVHYRPI